MTEKLFTGTLSKKRNETCHIILKSPTSQIIPQNHFMDPLSIHGLGCEKQPTERTFWLKRMNGISIPNFNLTVFTWLVITKFNKHAKGIKTKFGYIYRGLPLVWVTLYYIPCLQRFVSSMSNFLLHATFTEVCLLYELHFLLHTTLTEVCL